MSEQKEAEKADSAKDDPKIEVTESEATSEDLRVSDPGASKPEAAASDEKIDVTVADPEANDAPEIEPETAVPPPVPVPVPVTFTSSLPAREWPPRVIADLMARKVITLNESESLGELEAWMLRFRFQHLPVVGDGMKLVGLITRTDLLHAMLGVGPEGKPIAKATSATLCGAIMNTNVVSANPDDELTTACRVMLQERLSCLPVTLEDGTLVGILTATDFARLALEVLERSTAKS